LLSSVLCSVLQPCVMKMKNTPRTFLLGDIFFRRMVVVHDLRNPMQPLITVGQRKTDYSLTDKLVTLEDRSHVPLGKKLVQKVAFNTTLRHKHETLF